MNSRFYIKINPKFKFNKISLNKQTDFYPGFLLQKILFHYDEKNLIKRFNSESKINNNINDKQIKDIFSQYKKELNQKINNKYTDNFSSISNEKKISCVNSLRSKLSKNNSKLKNIDFNVNNSSDKDHELKLNINHYLSLRKINNKLSRNKGSQNKMGKYLSEDSKNNYDISLPNKFNILKINKSHCSQRSNELTLPHIPTNIIRKSNNMRSLIKRIEFNNNSSNISNNEIDNEDNKQITICNKKKNERDIFKNINFFIDNKKSTIKVNDIKRNIENKYNNDDIEKYIFKRRKSSLFNDKINKTINESNNNEDITKKEMKNINEGDRYMIYENSKKYIDTDKFYYSNKFGLANIPNVSLDEGVKNAKNFETNVINMKNTRLDLPICVKLTKQ